MSAHDERELAAAARLRHDSSFYADGLIREIDCWEITRVATRAG